MEHEFHLSEDVDRGGPAVKLIALLVVLIALCAVGAYVVYGSGMWSPVPQHTSV